MSSSVWLTNREAPFAIGIRSTLLWDPFLICNLLQPLVPMLMNLIWKFTLVFGMNCLETECSLWWTRLFDVLASLGPPLSWKSLPTLVVSKCEASNEVSGSIRHLEWFKSIELITLVGCF